MLLTALSLPWEVPQAAQHRQHPAPCCAGVAAPQHPLPPNQGSVFQGNTSIPCHACDTTLTASHCCWGADFGPPHSCWSPRVPPALLSRQGHTQNLSWTRQSQRRRRAEASSLLTPNKNISFLPTLWKQGCVHTRWQFLDPSLSMLFSRLWSPHKERAPCLTQHGRRLNAPTRCLMPSAWVYQH